MYAEVLVGEDSVSTTNDKAFEWPVTPANDELSALRVTELIESTNINLLQILAQVELPPGRNSSSLPRNLKATAIASNTDGIPVAAAYRKKLYQPIAS